MISILLLSWDRFDIISQTLPHNLRTCRQPYELLVCDQGSEQRVVDLIESFKPTYFRKNKRNEGISRSQNQLYLRASGDYICIMDNDLFFPDNWGNIAVEWITKIPRPGLIGFTWWDWLCPPLSTKFGISAHWLDKEKCRVFGPRVMARNVIETIGFNPEEFDVYGEDFDMNERINRAGFNSLYVPGVQSKHLGNDVGSGTDYRKMKDESIPKNMDRYNARVAAWDKGAPLREPLPELRDPLV